MPIGGKDAFLSKVTFRRESNWYSKTKQELKDMATIEERAEKHAVQFDKEIGSHHYSYCIGAKEQKAIDDAELAKLKKAWEKEAEVNHDAKKAYAQGYHDAVEKAYEWIINTYLGDYVTDEFGNGGIGDNVKLANDLRKAMEEE